MESFYVRNIVILSLYITPIFATFIIIINKLKLNMNLLTEVHNNNISRLC